mmetsp:Transcript_40646/g.95544  ORF Transcript_40646/g.95544 Transcript_40646/m.95544 type:complete len:80 (-) Transcript_40646:29-268(-)
MCRCDDFAGYQVSTDHCNYHHQAYTQLHHVATARKNENCAASGFGNLKRDEWVLCLDLATGVCLLKVEQENERVEWRGR